MADTAYQELATNIRRNLRHLARDMAGLAEAHRFIDYINHMDTLAQQIESATATPPADAALAGDALCESLIEASDMRWNGDVYVGDGADLMNLVRAALRARAVPEGDVIEKIEEYGGHRENEGGSYATFQKSEARRHRAEADAVLEEIHALLAASKAGEGK